MDAVQSDVKHTIPDNYYNQADYNSDRVALVQSLLDKWDTIMSDPSIPTEDKAFFKASFYGYMSELKNSSGDSFGPGNHEGFDNLLSAIEENNTEYLVDNLTDPEKMEKVMYAFSEAFKKAQESTGVEIGTEEDKLASMFLQNNWDGIDRKKKTGAAGSTET